MTLSFLRPAGYVLPMPDYPAHRKMARHLAAVTPEVRNRALAAFLALLQKNYAYYYSTPGYEPKAAALASDDALLAGFARHGIVAHRLPEAVKSRVRDDLAPLIQELSDTIAGKEPRARKFRDLNRLITPDRFPGAIQALSEWFGGSPLKPMFEAYVGSPLRISNIALQKNDDETALAHYGPIGSDGLPAGNKTRYMHIDSTIWPTVKILIYLNDISEDGGPFRYCLGSHLQPSQFEFLVRKTNDGLKLVAEEFLSLPEEFRQHALFGDFVDGSDLAAADLLGREWAVRSTDGDVICFDNNGVHRGGFVRSGYRLMLQINFLTATPG